MEIRKININNPEELDKFKLEVTGYVSSYGFPYRLDSLTDKGGNYTIFCPIRWKNAFSPAKLKKMLHEEVDADLVTVEYIDFIKTDESVKQHQKKDILLPMKKVCRWMKDNHIHYQNTDITTDTVISDFKMDMLKMI